MQTAQKTLALTVAQSGSVQYTFGPEETVGISGTNNPTSTKPYRWPDTTFGIMPSYPGTSPQPFTFFGSTQDGITTVRAQGTLDFPTRLWPGGDPTVFIPFIGVPSEYRYSGGGQVYKLTPDKWILFVESEVHRNFNNVDAFHNRLSVHKSSDHGLSWVFLGNIVESQAGYGSTFTSGTCNMGDGNYLPVTVGGVPYLYTFFMDFGPSGPNSMRISMARGKVSDLLAWFDGGSPAQFMKWDGAGFGQLGLGGLGARLITPLNDALASAPKVAFNTFLGRYIMNIEYFPTGQYPDSDNYFLDSSDLVNWGNLKTIPSPNRYEAKGTFCSIDGQSQHALGQQFYFYYNASNATIPDPQWRNKDDRICRRLVTVN